ncbi:MAG: IS1 family transposase [Dehalococcoidales bacterium]|nr:IS1 family transposase [Dehalococcoidales bacterium]
MNRPTHTTPVKCKYCGALETVKYGTFEGMQRHFCKICRRKFADNDALPGMKTPVWVISSVLHYYYEGMSIGAIQKQINQEHGAYYAESSIYNWVMRFSKQAIERAESFHPQAGDSWLVCEAILVIGQRQLWACDIFDIESKYLLASRLCESGITNEISGLLEITYRRAGKLPGQVITATPIDTYAKDIPHTAKYFRNILKKRNRIISNKFKSTATIQMLMDAWRIHYNFIAGDNRTPIPPAQKMGMAPFQDWFNLIIRTSDR